ncbi:MAG: anthranilate phosphoribosyltransferase, partial [Eubacteriaceae bacterium]|nr:anthranilate phosphoribosyltransferase [Eubacteriaceae bacterium]
VCAPTKICEIRDGWFRSYVITPEEFGISTRGKSEIRGGTPAENAEITRRILSGGERGAKRDAVLMNAGAALYIGGMAEDLSEGIRRAAAIIDSGKAEETLRRLIELSSRQEAAV